MDGCHQEAAHQGQRRSISLMQERFWWPGMARDLRNRIKKCAVAANSKQLLRLRLCSL